MRLSVLKAGFMMCIQATLLLMLLVFAVPQLRSETDNTMEELPEKKAMSPRENYFPMTPDEKIGFYLQSTVGHMSIFTSAFSAGYNQAIDSVPEWGRGLDGYGKRFASSISQKAIGNTVNSSLKILLSEDPRYFYADRDGVRYRTFYALGQILIAHRDSGDTRPNYSWFIGTASGVYASRQWRPENRRTATDYIMGAVAAVAAESAKNVFMEFWPDIKKKLLKRQ